MQGYVSKSVADFPFIERFGLTPYTDINEPCLFIGMYRDEDLLAALRHKGRVIVLWCGHDAYTFKDWYLVSKFTHICAHENIYKLINSMDLNCKLYPCINLNSELNVLEKGSKVYAYCPYSSPAYHNIQQIVNIKTKHEIVLGDGTINKEDWKMQADSIYGQCFIGLVLNDWCGGAQTIIDLGLRGIKCITNTISLPNCISYNTTKDIEKIIKSESKKIGTIDYSLAESVYNSLDNNLTIISENI